VLLVVVALAVLALRSSRTQTRRGLLLALVVGAVVAAYSLVDGVGVRSAGNALSYAAWLFLLQGVTVPLTCWVLSRDRRAFLAGLRRHARPGMLGGVLSLIAYAVVVWAQSPAPLALVSALRETGVIVAVFAGRLLFGEPLTTRGVAASGLVAVGVVLLRASTALARRASSAAAFEREAPAGADSAARSDLLVVLSADVLVVVVQGVDVLLGDGQRLAQRPRDGHSPGHLHGHNRGHD